MKAVMVRVSHESIRRYIVYQMYTICIFMIEFNKISLMKTVTAKYARQNFAEILNEVHFGRKKIVITRSGKPLIVLISTRDYKAEK